MKTRSRRLIPFLVSCFVLCASFSAAADTLDAKAARSLVSDRIWKWKARSGPATKYWSWTSDGRVCLRIEDKNGKCADTGRWKLDTDRLCYDLKWGGASLGVKSNCFRISDKGNGIFEAVQDNGLTFFEFSVVK